MPHAARELRMRTGLPILTIHTQPFVPGDIPVRRARRDRYFGRRRNLPPDRSLLGRHIVIKQFTKERRPPSGSVKTTRSVVARHTEPMVDLDRYHVVDLLLTLRHQRDTVWPGRVENPLLQPAPGEGKGS